MATLIYASNSDGCIGKCDANCYNAMHPDCDCICGGRNHGAGLDRARKNTQEYADEMMEEYKKCHQDIKDLSCQVNHEEISQLKLF